MNRELDSIKNEISANRGILERDFSISKIGVFGSVARGDAHDGSDVDVLVELKQPIGLFRFESLRLFLQGLLHVKVDLATPRSLKPLLRDEIEKSVIYV